MMKPSGSNAIIDHDDNFAFQFSRRPSAHKTAHTASLTAGRCSLGRQQNSDEF